MNNVTLAQSNCLHCGAITSSGATFCCPGCNSIYSLLANKDLLSFYKNQKGKAVAVEAGVEIDSLKASFYIEGIHCLGCLWILEKLPELFPSISTSKLNFGSHILHLEVNAIEAWGPALRLIQQLGYKPHPLKSDLDAQQKQDSRVQLIKIGIAAFCTGNLMTLSASLYAGADSIWAKIFPWMSLILFLPIAFFSALPIYRSAFQPLILGKISVDLPVALAIFAGILLSVWNLVTGSGAIYFDSLSMLVFLLLSSRFALQQMRNRLSNNSQFLDFFPKQIEKSFPQNEMVAPNKLCIGDHIVLQEGEKIPADCILKSAFGYFNYSLLTGESFPKKVLHGDNLEAGVEVLQETHLKVNALAQNSRLAKILEQIQFYRMGKSPSLALADRIGRVFLYTVLFLSTLLVAYFYNNLNVGIERALALMIVTCPCVLAFAIPLSFTRAIQIAGKKGILLKNPEKLESFANIKNIFLDKTGTLTFGDFSVLSWETAEDSKTIASVVLGLEQRSFHPVAKAIVRHLRNKNILPAQVTQIVQKTDGIEGIFDGIPWSVQRLDASPNFGENWVGVFRANQQVATIKLGDKLREDSKQIISDLKKSGRKIFLLSGDRESNVKPLAESLGFDAFYFDCDPEAKAQIVKQKTNSLMVGDGANDAIAFQSADIGIAVHGSMELSLKNADIVFTSPGLKNLEEIFQLSKNSLSLVKQNFIFSLCFNLVAGVLAILGLMSPLLAAVLMPLSALSVFIHTYFRTEKFL
jgi:P-type Cu+ transporter